MSRPSVRVAAIAAALAALVVPAAASAAPVPLAYGSNDGGGFHSILPPGTNGTANAADLAAFLAAGVRPMHNADQRDMYANLVFAAPGLQAADLDKYYKDATFGVKAGGAERTYSPRGDVTIVRDAKFGVPKVYGATRDGAMFGLGYVAGEDRMFFIDVLRHAGRSELSTFVGGAAGNRAMDEDIWANTPYTEADLETQIARAPVLYGAEGESLLRDLDQYVAGINGFIADMKLNPLLKLPAEYAAIGHPEGPAPWTRNDVVAIASLVGGIFGNGGGGELGSALLRQQFEKVLGRKRGAASWRDFRSANDPEALTTVHTRRFPYQVHPLKPRGTAMPDGGKVIDAKTVVSATGGAASPSASSRSGDGILGRALLDGIRGGLRGTFPHNASNALVVSARESASGRPLAVFGPQVSYFAPQILMEEEVHAPSAPGRPALDSSGASFPGTNLYVQLGRGRDYAWSATSAGNDIIDTFAVPLCTTDGSAPTTSSDHYLFRRQCLPFEVLERTISWQPTVADSTAAGSETLRTLRTKLGIVHARGTVRGKPVAFTLLRTTYMHEVDAARGFADLNSPDKIHGPDDFYRASYGIDFTFNWLYVDHDHVAYFNSGKFPVRPKNTDVDFPVDASREWVGFNPDNLTSAIQPLSVHARTTDQDRIVSWNGKQARGVDATDGNYSYSSLDRGQLLDDRIRRGIAGTKKMTLVGLVDAMEDAGTVDLRGDKVVPYALAVMGKQTDPQVAAAIEELRSWVADGSHRRDRNHDGTIEHQTAIRIMDAWWPRWLQAEFAPRLGADLAKRVIRYIGEGDLPSIHQGSSFDDGIWGQANKDLRTLLHRKVKGRYSMVYCGAGSRKRCAADLARTLKEAAAVPATQVWKGEGCDPGNLQCNDEVRFRAIGGITQPSIPWINRPTFQQAVEVQSKASR